jgi:uncharacterized repeat protein (TIGR03803 family)
MTKLSECATAAAVFLALCPAAAAQQPAFGRLAGLPPHAYGGLIQGLDGNLYSTTSGAGRAGEVFRITPEGALTKVHKLAGQSQAGLLLATDGNLYGTTLLGGSPTRVGTIFRVTPRGKLTSMYTFCQEAGCPDGEEPSAPLIQATDGNLYGTTGGAEQTATARYSELP